MNSHATPNAVPDKPYPFLRPALDEIQDKLRAHADSILASTIGSYIDLTGRPYPDAIDVECRDVTPPARRQLDG